MLEPIVNFFLFKPPQPQQPYSFTNDIVNLKTSRKDTTIAATILERKSAKATILYSHGNAEDLSVIFPYLLKLAFELDCNVVGYDYSGYGESKGEPSEQNCCDDIVTVFDFMTVNLGIPPESIILYGRSLGSGPTCYLADRLSKENKSIAGVILYAPFKSVFRLVLPDAGFTVYGDPFPNIDRIQQIRCPLMLIHGESDQVVPFSHGQALFAAARNARSDEDDKRNVVFFHRKDMGHNDVPTLIGMEMLHAKRNFLKLIL